MNSHNKVYVSPYFVITPQGYTKHYYAESERVASRIGGGFDTVDLFIQNFWEFVDKPETEASPFWTDEYNVGFINEKRIFNLEHLYQAMECAGEMPSIADECLVILHGYIHAPYHEDEPECYWYHPDHLGSSSWITDKGGFSAQHLHYLPWGENFVDQRSYTFDGVRYTFSAKEKDAETGFSYFGSRYYNSELSIWLSVDPMSDKYPSLSPYVYCANNPIKLVDPNGEEWEIDGYIYTPGGTCPDNVSQSTKDKWNTMNKIYGTREGKTVIDAMNKKGVCYSVSSEKCPSGPAGGEYVSDGNKTGGTIYLNGKNSDVGLLAHEMFHGYQDLNNQGSQTIHNELQARLFATDIQNQTFSPGIPQLTPKGDILPEVFSYNVNKVISGTYSSQNMQYLEDTFKEHFDGYENVKIRKEGQTDLYGTIKRIY